MEHKTKNYTINRNGAGRVASARALHLGQRLGGYRRSASIAAAGSRAMVLQMSDGPTGIRFPMDHEAIEHRREWVCQNYADNNESALWPLPASS